MAGDAGRAGLHHPGCATPSPTRVARRLLMAVVAFTVVLRIAAATNAARWLRPSLADASGGVA